MKQKPWPIVILAVLHWLSPIGNIFANSVHYKISFSAFVAALFFPQNKIHFAALVLLPIVSGVCIFICRRWSYIAYIVLMALAFSYSLLTSRQFFVQNAAFIASTYLVNLVIVGYILIPNIRKIYFNPRLRWWQAKPRFATDFISQVQRADGNKFEGHIKNISTGGFFIETSVILDVNELVQIHFQFDRADYQINATTVFHRKGSTPGFGFRVEAVDARRSGLRRVVNHLRQHGALVEGRSPSPDDRFINWLKKSWSKKSAWLLENPS